MTKSVEQELQQQVRDEIGDEENIKFPRKNQLNLKYGVITPTISLEEIEFWEKI